MAFAYQNFASLGVNLNRQKYGPLDISSVFNSQADLNYYITKGASKVGVSQYWLDVTPYPYAGQIVALASDGELSVFVLKEKMDGTFETVAVGSRLSADGKAIIDTDGILSLKGFDAASANQQLRKNADGELEWFTPDTSTVSGLADTVGQHTTQISTLEEKVKDTYTKGEVDQKVAGAFHFKGEQESLDALNALTDKKNGDVYQIGDKEYAYNGTAWVELGFNINLEGYVTKEEGKGLSSNDFTTALKNKLEAMVEGAEVNVIESVDETEFSLDAAKKLTVGKISKDKIDGLAGELAKKVDAEDGKRLMTTAEGEKLAKVNENAQVNTIEAIMLNGVALSVDAEKKSVNIPLGSTESAGAVKGSEATDKIAVDADGTMKLNQVSTSKLTQAEGDTLILDGGTSAQV